VTKLQSDGWSVCIKMLQRHRQTETDGNQTGTMDTAQW